MSAAGILLLAAPGVPLAMTLLVLAPTFRPALFRLMPAAALPALAAALFLPAGTAELLPRTLLGAGLVLDEMGKIFLGVAALLWLLAGIHAAATISGERSGRFAGFWLATLSGNMLLFVAADAVSFYLAFALLSLAAFGLVIHSGSAEAMRAGRIYLVLAIFGELCLLLGLLIGATAAETILIPDIRAALPDAPYRDLAIGLLVCGFGLKAGLMPLHVWLPLAHPAAPVPASAVLSGAIVKAGVFGLVRFLPLEADLPGWSAALVALGLATAYLGVAFGVVQQRPKTVLAYSTLSQMGLVTVVLASGFGSPGTGLVLAAVLLYSAHHGLAKGALFLSVGVLAASGGRAGKALLCIAALAALAIAGLPFTGGALAKLAIKGPVGEGYAALLVTISAAGTTLLMLRFVQLMLRSIPTEERRPPTALWLPFILCAAAALALPWLLFPSLAELTLGYAVRPSNLWGALWPMLIGAAVMAGALRLRRHAFRIPEGDVVVVGERGFEVARRSWRKLRVEGRRRSLPEPGSWRTPPRLDRLLDLGERGLARWPVAGTLLLAVAGLAILLSIA